MKTRRDFLTHTLIAAGGLFAGCSSLEARKAKVPYKISLAEWSLHKELFAKKITHMDFPAITKQEFDIDGLELVNQFFKDKATDQAYLNEFKKRSDDLGLKILLIMIDGEGALGDPEESGRVKAIENHHKWIDAAKFFGCHSIRVNAETKEKGTFEEQQKRAADGLARLSQYGAKNKINVIVENHGHLSSNGKWLAGVMRMVNMPNCGTLPDFGNFTDYDRYLGVEEMMPFAKAVSAKSNDFDANGEETHIDYKRMVKIVLDAGYHGYLGIEYEGNKIPEREGIRLTKALLEKVRFAVNS